jgi:hypothetical protein
MPIAQNKKRTYDFIGSFHDSMESHLRANQYKSSPKVGFFEFGLEL